jgi:chemotaxis protein methyltransferase CheR
MSSLPARPALQQLVALIRDVTGNVVPTARYGFLEEMAIRRAHIRGFPGLEEYVRALAAREIEEEWKSVIPLITIKESYFFRAPQQFDGLRQHVLPRLLRARSGARHLRIWCGACARGEEPGTLAIVLAEEPSLAGWDWTIVATDVDEEALSGARLGLYGERAVAQVPPRLRDRWFARRGKLYELDPSLRSRIVYSRLNLAHPPFELPFPELDLILLRNVLIYFRRPLQRWVMSQVSRFLAPRGYLFLGASETLWQIQDDLEPVDLGSCFCYRHRREQPEPAAAAAAPPRARREPRPEPAGEPRPRLDPEHPRDWSVLRGALAGPSPAPEPAAAEPPPVDAPTALEHLAAAARHLAANRLAEAGRGVEAALAADPSEPAAHALEGFLHDLQGRTEEAVTSYRAALYLDPALFQARLLLADCLLRLGARDRAEHQYREVLSVLESGRERALVLFEELPLPDRERVQRRCRQVLQGRG